MYQSYDNDIKPIVPTICWNLFELFLIHFLQIFLSSIHISITLHIYFSFAFKTVLLSLFFLLFFSSTLSNSMCVQIVLAALVQQ